MEQFCGSYFRKHDANGNGVLEWNEVVALTRSLCENLGTIVPGDDKLRKVFVVFDKNSDQVLSNAEFMGFFRALLKASLSHLEQVDTQASDIPEQEPGADANDPEIDTFKIVDVAFDPMVSCPSIEFLDSNRIVKSRGVQWR